MAGYNSVSIATNICSLSSRTGHIIRTHQVGVTIGPKDILIPVYETFCVRCGLSLDRIRTSRNRGKKDEHADSE